MSQKKSQPQEEQPEKTEVEQLQEQIAQLDELLQAEKDAKLRAMADFQNYRKRMDEERATFGAIANAGLIQELLEIYDDLQFALNDESLNLDSAKQSMINAQSKLLSAAESAGIVSLGTKPGDEFDSSTMEAISQIPNEELKNKVVAVISTGFKYRSKDGVIKSSKVVIGK